MKAKVAQSPLPDLEAFFKSNNFFNPIISKNKSNFDLFEVYYEGHNYFLKLASSRNGNKENFYLQKLICEKLYPDLETLLIEDSNLVCLAIPELAQKDKYSFQDINRLLIESCTVSLSLPDNFQKSNTIEKLVKAGMEANRFFYEKGSLPVHLYELVNLQIRTLKDFLPYAGRIINHGDVSNPNIFLFKESLILLDWEDMMLGIPGYDQVYWLTFMANSNQINLENLEAIPLPLEIVHSIFFLVVILKEYLSALNPTRMNHLSTQDRINGLLELPKFR